MCIASSINVIIPLLVHTAFPSESMHCSKSQPYLMSILYQFLSPLSPIKQNLPTTTTNRSIQNLTISLTIQAIMVLVIHPLRIKHTFQINITIETFPVACQCLMKHWTLYQITASNLQRKEITMHGTDSFSHPTVHISIQ